MARNRMALGMACAVVIALVGLQWAPSGQAQGRAMRIGTVSAKASHGEADLNGRTVLLTGSVTIQTADGQNLSADSVQMAMGRNPVTKKDDVASAVATGNVRFRTVQTVKPTGGAAAYQRVINGTADKAVWHRFDRRADLTGGVTVVSDDPLQTVTWRHAAKATIDLKAGRVYADKAENGPQMTFDMVSKGG